MQELSLWSKPQGKISKIHSNCINKAVKARANFHVGVAPEFITIVVGLARRTKTSVMDSIGEMRPHMVPLRLSLCLEGWEWGTEREKGSLGAGE